MDEILKLFGGAENIWAAIQQNASKVGLEATRVMLELFYVLKSPTTSIFDKTLIVAALGYQLLPEDALPRDEYGLFGFLDNGVTLAFAYNRVKSSVTPEIEQQVNNVLINWFGSDIQEGNSPAGNTGIYGTFAPPVVPPSVDTPKTTITPRPGNYGWNDDEDVVID